MSALLTDNSADRLNLLCLDVLGDVEMAVCRIEAAAAVSDDEAAAPLRLAKELRRRSIDLGHLALRLETAVLGMPECTECRIRRGGELHG